MKFDYFDEVIKYDPVNHYICFTIDELKALKKNISKDELKYIQDMLEDSLNISYKDTNNSVINKVKPIPNIDLKDYVSLATYYWPDETKFDGLPYVPHDGKSNPEGDLYDKNNLRRLAYITYQSAILYYLTNDKKYHDIIVENCTYYFLDEKTGMNPNMNHAQMIIGVNDGRGIGIIDYSGNFTYALLMLKNLRQLDIINHDFYEQFKKWHKEFLYWLTHNEIALQEKYSKNNHGTLYDFLLIVLFDFLDMSSEIIPLVYDFIEYRISSQIEITGEMPHETARTKSISYSLMGYKGMFDFARIAKKYGYDLWNINSWYYHRIKSNLKLTMDYLYKYLIKQEETWPFKQITVFDKATLIPLIFEGIMKYGEDYDYFNKINKEDMIHDIIYVLAKNAKN